MSVLFFIGWILLTAAIFGSLAGHELSKNKKKEDRE